MPAFPGEKKSCLNITGVPGFLIENVTFRGLHLTFPGGGTKKRRSGLFPNCVTAIPNITCLARCQPMAFISATSKA